MGLSASGKTFQAKRISEHFGLRLVCGSDILSSKFPIKPDPARHDWLGDSGRLIEKFRDNTDLDRATDDYLLELARVTDNIIFDSWTVPWLYKERDLIRIYLNPTIDARVLMAIHSRDVTPYSETEMRLNIQKKDESSRVRFKQLYEFDCFSVKGFDIIFDNSESNPNETSDALIKRLNIEIERTTLTTSKG